MSDSRPYAVGDLVRVTTAIDDPSEGPGTILRPSEGRWDWVVDGGAWVTTVTEDRITHA